jgi:hypothetical protein
MPSWRGHKTSFGNLNNISLEEKRINLINEIKRLNIDPASKTYDIEKKTETK